MTTTPDAERTSASRRDDTGELETAVAMMAKIRTCWSPSFSPDGKSLAFVSDLNGVPQVWTVPVEGGWPTLVTALDDQIMRVEWSPNGEWIAYSSDRNGNADIWIQPVGQENPRRVTSSPDNDWQPAWSRDGRYIAFRSERNGGGLYIVRPDGTGERKLADFGYEPRWSADSSLLLWEVAGKWSPRALVLLKIEDGKVKWQRDLLKMAQQAILTRTRKFLPKDFAAFTAIDVHVNGNSKEDAPLSLPLAVHAEFDSNPKAMEPPPSVYVHSEMEATIDSDAKLIVKKFRKE